MAWSAQPSDAIVEAFLRLVAQRPNGLMAISPTRRATFAQIESLSREVGERIAAAPLGSGSLIGLAAPNGPAFLAGFLAIRRANQAALLLDPMAPAEDRRRVVTVMGAATVLDCEDAWPASARDFRLSQSAGSDLLRTLPGIAAVRVTSGSTGIPRGVAMPPAALLADEAALAFSMGFRNDDRLLAAIPMSHSYGFTTLALSSIVRGLTVVLPGDDGPFAPLKAAEDLGATVFPTVPAYIQGLLKLAQPPAWPSGIRLVISAGAPLSRTTAAQFRETYGQRVHVFYGSSECGGISYDREGMAAERGSVGTPVEGVRIFLNPCESGAEGEGLVTVESASVGQTYLPESNPRLESGRFETSDLAVWQEGELVLRRRIDDVINVRGRKVDPSEVEKVLADLQGVEEVVVLGVASADHREEIVRAVVACPSGLLGYEDVALWCRARLADHKVPRSVVIVDAIPRTARGKIDRTALLRLRNPDSRPVHG